MPTPDTLKLKPTATAKTTVDNIMEQMGQYKQQAQQQAQGSVMNVRNWLVQSINSTSDTLRHYINRYPPLAAFLFTLIVLSAVPVACFTVFTFVTSAIFLTVALIGFGVVEGLCLMAGGGVLLAVLGGITLVTTIGFAWISLVYVAWRGSSVLAQRLMEGGQQLGQKTQEAIHQMQQQSGQSSNPITGSSYQQHQPTSGIFSSSSTSQPQIRRSFSSVFKPLCCFTDEEEAIRDLGTTHIIDVHRVVRTFAQKQVAPLVHEMDQKQAIPRSLVDSLFEHGLMGIEIDRDKGGVGSTFTSALLAVEEMAKVDPSVSVFMDVHNTLVNTVINKFGSDLIKQEYLPKLATNTVGCFCLSESGSGSDAFALKTRATADGDDYLLSGEKMWITNSDHAGIFLVFATVDPSLGYKGITCFLVDRETEGLKLGKKENKLGICASGTCTVQLDNVRVSKSKIIGEVGLGYKIAIEILNEGRIGIAAQMLGLAKGAYEKTMPYLFQRKQFNTAIGDFQYAEVALQIETAHLLTYNAARLKQNNLPFVKEAAMAKLHASRVAEQTASRCIEWLGGVGFTRDFGVEKFYRDCKIGAIYEGTSNIQLSTIAKLLSKQYQ